MKKKLHITCLAFNQPGMVKEAIELCESQIDGYPIATKTLVDCHWPLGDGMVPGQPQLQTQMLAHIAAKHGYTLMRPYENRGVSKNWQWVITELGLTDGDVLMSYDPDARLQQKGWPKAMMDVFESAPEAYTVQMNRECIYSMKNLNGADKKINETWVVEYPQLISWSCGAFDIGWMNRIGGINQYWKYYGMIEHSVYDRAQPLGGKFYMLRDFYDHHLQSPDPKYVEWKIKSAAKQTEKGFGEWLKENR